MRNLRLSALILLFFSVFSIFALAKPANSNNPSALKDGQIMGVIMVVDRSEIKAAQLALQKTSNPNVKNFANAMIVQHGQNLMAIRDLARKTNIMPQGSNLALNLSQQGQQEFKSLTSLKKGNFDKAYINAMINGHQMVLNTLNNKFIPNAKNPAVIKFLKSTAETVEHHLAMAKEVNSKL